MQKEKIFSKDGCYSQVVKSNILCHQEAIVSGTEVIKNLLNKIGPSDTVNVLDLACGAEPISIASILQQFPTTKFNYTGIDINPDQVSYANNHFQFPDNIINKKIIEGNAWDPMSCEEKHSYDIIYMGLNLHHGTPEEVYYLASQINLLLSEQGAYINHDVFRPNDQPYQRRPKTNPDDNTEPFDLLDPALLHGIQLPDITNNETAYDGNDTLWRKTYCALLRDSLINNHAERECAESAYQHVISRDYPISLNDFSAIFKQVNNAFSINVIHYDNSAPLVDYIAMPVVSRLT